MTAAFVLPGSTTTHRADAPSGETKSAPHRSALMICALGMGCEAATNDPAHRPRAKGARLETTAFSRGSVEPAGSAAWSLSLSSLSWGGGRRCGLCAGRRGKWRGDNVVLDVDPSRASLPWRGEVAGQPAKQTDGDCCEQHDLRCSRCFHAIGIV